MEITLAIGLHPFKIHKGKALTSSLNENTTNYLSWNFSLGKLSTALRTDYVHIQCTCIRYITDSARCCSHRPWVYNVIVNDVSSKSIGNRCRFDTQVEFQPLKITHISSVK